MKKHTWGVMGFVVLAAAATALAVAPLRVTTLVPEGKGVCENPAADGMAKLSFFIDPVNGPSVEAHVHLHHFVGNTPYSLVIDTDAGGGDFVDVVTTNGGGDGNVRITFPVSFAPTSAVILVYRNQINDGGYTGDDAETPFVNEDEARAVGASGI